MTSQLLQTEPYSLHLFGSHNCTRAVMGTSRNVIFLIIVMMLTAVTAMMVMVTAVMVTAMMVMVILTAVMETWLIAWTYVALAAAT